MCFSLIRLGCNSPWAYEDEGECEKKSDTFNKDFQRIVFLFNKLIEFIFQEEKIQSYKLLTTFIDKAWCPKQDKMGTDHSLLGSECGTRSAPEYPGDSQLRLWSAPVLSLKQVFPGGEFSSNWSMCSQLSNYFLWSVVFGRGYWHSFAK